MPTRIVEGQLPYTGGTGIGIDTNKVISILLREENNLIEVNGDNELYTDLQLAVNITPSSDFPVGVTVGKVLAENGWSQNGLILNWKTTSGDYARWLYGADGKLYFDGGQGTWKQVYYSEEVDALFTALRGELATVAFSGDYNDLINRPAFLQVQADWDQTDTDAPDYIKNKPTLPVVNDATLTIQKNGAAVGTFTANASANTSVNITVPNVINNVTSTSTSDALSANQGKVLQDQIDDLKAMGRFLSLWDCETGMPISFPLATPYNYQTGDYFLVENVDTTTNYRPNGVQYTGTASTTVETDEVEVGDLYIYDGAVWLLQINHGKSVSFANLAGQPSDNAALASALNAKADVSSLATVATSGSYNDLTNKPTIPSAQVNSDWNANSGVAQILNKPTIPTNTSQLNNDSGYITSSYHDSSKQDVLTAGDNINISNNVISAEVNTKTFYAAGQSDWNTTLGQSVYNWIKDGNYAILHYGVHDTVLFLPTNTTTGTITSEAYNYSKAQSNEQTEVSQTFSMVVSNGTVTSTDSAATVNGVGNFFAPGGTATTGYVVTKTANGYEWATPQGTTYNAGEGIEIGTVQDYSAMQGPAPEGFHVPSNNEWVALCGILTSTFSMASNATTMGTYLKMPMTGYRNYSSSNVVSQGTYGHYWSSTAYSEGSSYLLYFSSSTLAQRSYIRAHGFSVRCFKDFPVIPNSSWTTLYQGSGSSGVFRNSSLGLISVSGDGITWYTIQDKNLGATTVYNNGDTLSEANCGKYFQWGNNYGFPFSGDVTTSSTQVDASGYGPGNYYSSDTFIIRSASPYDWSSSNNDNLRGGVTGVVTLDNAITNTGVLSVNGQTGDVTIETFQLAPNSPLSPKYRRYGTQAQYDALTQYYTDEEGDTVYYTI